MASIFLDRDLNKFIEQNTLSEEEWLAKQRELYGEDAAAEQEEEQKAK